MVTPWGRKYAKQREKSAALRPCHLPLCPVVIWDFNPDRVIQVFDSHLQGVRGSNPLGSTM